MISRPCSSPPTLETNPARRPSRAADACDHLCEFVRNFRAIQKTQLFVGDSVTVNIALENACLCNADKGVGHRVADRDEVKLVVHQLSITKNPRVRVLYLFVKIEIHADRLEYMLPNVNPSR